MTSAHFLRTCSSFRNVCFMCAGRNEEGKCRRSTSDCFDLSLPTDLHQYYTSAATHPPTPRAHTPPPFALIDSHAGNKIWLQSSRDLTSFSSAEEHGCGAFMFSHTRRHMRTGALTHTLARPLTHTHIAVLHLMKMQLLFAVSSGSDKWRTGCSVCGSRRFTSWHPHCTHEYM